MYQLPTSVEINGQEYAITEDADYHVIIDCIAACQDNDLTKTEQTVAALMVFYECLQTEEDIYYAFDDIQQAVDAMMNFISLGNDDVGYQVHRKLIDWVQDEKLIVSAVNNVAKTEIRALPYMHWWTFIGYYMGIGECPLSTIVGIRDKISRGKKLEKYEQEIRRQNPQYFTWKNKSKKDEELEKRVDDMWNKQ